MFCRYMYVSVQSACIRLNRIASPVVLLRVEHSLLISLTQLNLQRLHCCLYIPYKTLVARRSIDVLVSD